MGSHGLHDCTQKEEGGKKEEGGGGELRPHVSPGMAKKQTKKKN